MNKLTTMELFDIKSKIYTIRDKHVMLDRDLALLYGVETKRINEAVRNNPRLFTEQGVYMLATILKSKVASEITVSIIKRRT
ncbi:MULTISPECIES: ORF6N domain-containing protein [Pasteurellaceae]|uniref:ORF6N domain-containing protein n=1 Tax=Pasteurella atlantica TaxID=2827233 RepID=A0AAW8CRU0_9PAST|nr:ORF6N domain-containing protein [Pasteurella atlantica]MDP8039441.1 ORF6N domain-containing protein [Pasteurella atlantica]MDP8041532.1 ORF6N domain-containing protein [Pasteurella atlantica]MDP8043669.1 ORF6N domain-containing protein [Pasteurella atlantica]MDP8045834.1 ORF6N domain-containing protein [Pasteurella atlantica]MDP8061690.1 ORF6N domain-containing protein [Pasteurella atlantica]